MKSNKIFHIKNLFIYFSLLVSVGCKKPEYANTLHSTPDAIKKVTLANNITGHLQDDIGNPVKNVVVSDGFTCTITDDNGNYTLTRDSAAQFVYFSAPAEYNASVGSSGLREFYKKITAPLSDAVQADFTLIKKAKETKFKIIGISDPQVASTAELNRFKNETVDDIKTNMNGESLPYYTLVLGDVVADKQDLLVPIRQSLATISPSTFVVAGNHDLFKSATNQTKNGEIFSAVFGPLDYSFNVGDVHFICMNDIIFAADGSYSSGFTAKQLIWLQQDLSYVSKDKVIVMSYHRHTLNTGGTEMKNLLAGYKEVHIMAGHLHANANNINSANPLFYQHIHGAACGRWWSSTINADGTPNGYQVFEVENNAVKNWYYKSVRYPKDFQIRMYRGNSSFGGPNGTFSFNLTSSQIVANVWNMDSSWKVDVYENNVKTGTMERFTGIDAWATGYHNGVLTEKAFANPEHLYKYTLKDPGATVKIVATDRFGTQYTQTNFTTDLSTAASY
ncbi:calcineurin-like phosphoesterase C-terminal domain-containing protein [Chitinophaga filiformis]|uniref:Calcineurin-like phosphoesterase family protein n=1 Tax=Chitinophaga filiformis TaxID=104663 RepID=A0ABY4I0V6_CHIFI|nr:calcineurin-like phosphoesterase family protein [Chitinophaga filiformis]UPK69024.1 calcineurin-like phosphoesterase family protein [Chitinophaga filiformis]